MYKKFQRLKLQGSNDGVNWFDVTPFEYKRGDVIEEDSKDCGGYGGVTQNRWVEVYGEYLCINNDKYQKLKKQYLDTATGDWVDVEPLETMQGELIEKNSEQCGYAEEWVDTDDWGCKEVETPITYFKVYPMTDGNGTIHISPSLESYPSGTNITISNAPYNNYVFSKYIYGLTENYEYTENNSVFNLNVNNDWYIKVLFSESKPAPAGNLYYSYSDGTESYYDWTSNTLGSTDNNGLNAVMVIDYGNVITNLRKDAFWSNVNLSYVSFSKLQTIGSYAFEKCSLLNNIDFSLVSRINRNTFQSCSALEQVNLPNVEYVDSFAFCACPNLSTITLPKATYIGLQAFGLNDTLTTVNLPNVISIATNAFVLCPLHNISIPKCEIIGEYAFQSCYSLSEITLPLVKTISSWAFESCFSLARVNILSPSVCDIKSYVFSNTMITSSTGGIYVPSSLVDDYKGRYNSYKNIIFPIEG